MNDHQKETAFLRHCLRYGEGAEHEALDSRIIQIQRDERCVRRAVWLTAMLTALAVAGFGYAVLLVDNFPYNQPQFIVSLACALGAGSLISLMVFLCLGMVYRTRLDQRREECRQLVTRLLDSRLGKPVNTRRLGVPVAREDHGTDLAAAGVIVSSNELESTAGG